MILLVSPEHHFLKVY